MAVLNQTALHPIRNTRVNLNSRTFAIFLQRNYTSLRSRAAERNFGSKNIYAPPPPPPHLSSVITRRLNSLTSTTNSENFINLGFTLRNQNSNKPAKHACLLTAYYYNIKYQDVLMRPQASVIKSERDKAIKPPPPQCQKYSHRGPL